MTRPRMLILFSTVVFASAAWAAPEARTIEREKLEFSVTTNVNAFKFRGEATELKGKVSLDGASVVSAELNVPVGSLTTHMNLRDKHMRERVFTKPDGSTPDLTFKAGKSPCEKKDGALVCTLKGTLSVRGQEHAKDVVVTATPADKPTAAKGSFVVKLSEHGIEAPTNLGVTVKDEIPVEFEVKLP